MQNTDSKQGILWLFYVSLCPGTRLARHVALTLL